MELTEGLTYMEKLYNKTDSLRKHAKDSILRQGPK